MSSKLFMLAAICALFVLSANASDPDITKDFIVPSGAAIDSNLFTFKGFEQTLLGGPKDGSLFKATKASQVEFPILDGQSVSAAVLQFGPRGLNAPHTHPRSTELLIVIQGTLLVGFVDSNDNLYTQYLQTGDTFVFPKGLIHYEINVNRKSPTVAISAFGSANPGTISLPKNIFGSGIPNWILAQSFKVDSATINKLIEENKS